jgi:hypothetical protein
VEPRVTCKLQPRAIADRAHDFGLRMDVGVQCSY